MHKTVAVVGSRTFDDYEKLKTLLTEYRSKYSNVKCRLISGGAQGADRLAERYALEHHIDIIVLKPNWSLYGRSAGIMRNTDIIKQSDTVIAFWDGKSKGTLDAINKAHEYQRELFICRF